MMKVGDLIQAVIIPGHPLAVITGVVSSVRWGGLYHVEFVDSAHSHYTSLRLKTTQMKLVSEVR